MAKGTRKRHKQEPQKQEFRLKPGHHDGPGSGYTIHPGGFYELAPCDRDSFDILYSEINAVRNLVNSVMDHAQERLAILERRRAEWFRSTADNVDRLEDVGRARYDVNANRLSFAPKGDPPPK